MNLCEQYYNRHKILIPIIKHIKFGSLFFRTNVFPFHKVICISWREPLYEPGLYLIESKSIKRFSGVNLADQFNCVGHIDEIISTTKSDKEFAIGWNNYESFLSNLNQSFDLENFEIVSNKHEVILFAWEIFVFSQEEFLMQNFSHLKKHIFDSVDIGKDIKYRYLAYSNFIKDCIKFEDKNSITLDFLYKTLIFPYIDNYVYWLAKMIKND